ncbi:HEAT repeat domain-containing protein [uncultured Gimesia sp.]|uniref:HEAT repeat domain-containing protein n=1 Tax=uncultured Gimesia sp. TaxID=1678688 RepID=UPI002638AF6F|nr:HEAT repeat domain-containing protein [uncultured Gimesia sp.]
MSLNNRILAIFALVFLFAISTPTRAWAQDKIPPKIQESNSLLNLSANDLLLSKPETPEQLLQAVIQLTDLGQAASAKPYLEQLIKANIDNETVLKLRDKHGPAAFLGLANNKTLQPESITLLKKMETAFRAYATDPARIDGLINDLAGSSTKRNIAIIELKSAGEIVAPPILRKLSTNDDPGMNDELAFALTQLGAPVVQPLIAALRSPTEKIRKIAADVLGDIGDPSATLYLWNPAFSQSQPQSVQRAARMALEKIYKTNPRKVKELNPHNAQLQLINAALHLYQTHEDKSEKQKIWTWDLKEQTIVQKELPTQEINLIGGLRLAKEALEMSPDRQDVQTLYLAMALAMDAYYAGWNNPLPEGQGTAFNLALLSGPKAVSRVLALAMKQGHTPSAIAALKALGQIGSRTLLYEQLDKHSSVIAALNYPDRRVQFSAATTIMQLDPVKPFPGATRVISILSRSLLGEGSQAAIVVDSSVPRAQSMAGVFNELGYLTQPVQTGKAGFKAATERMDVEFIALQFNIMRWGLSQTIANLRADSRTANIPILIYGPLRLQNKIEYSTRHYPLVHYIVETENTEDVERQVTPFLQSLKTPQLTGDLRTEYRTAALYWLSHIASSQRSKIYDLTPVEKPLLQLVPNRSLASNALITLGGIPTRSAQSDLAKVVTNKVFESDVKEIAALQLAFHIQKFGLLIDSEQITAIRQAYQTAKDPKLNTALASVMGTLMPDSKVVGERLQKFQPATSLP